MRVGSYLALVGALVAVPLATLHFAVQRLRIGEYGVRENPWTGDVEARDRGVGVALVLPGVHRLHRINARAQLVILGGGDPPRPPLELRTRDDNMARVSLALLVRVLPGRAHELVRRGAEAAHAERLQSTVEETLRADLARLSSEEWFDPELRAARLAAAVPALREGLERIGLELLDVFAPSVAFSGEYETRLQAGQISAQRRSLELAKDEVSVAEAALHLAEEETKALEKERTAAWQLERSQLVLTADAERAAVAAAATARVAESARAADERWHALVGTAEDALARARGDAERLRYEALAAEGGRVLVARRAAQSLKLERVELDARDPRVPLALDLDRIVELLLGTRP